MNTTQLDKILDSPQSELAEDTRQGRGHNYYLWTDGKVLGVYSQHESESGVSPDIYYALERRWEIGRSVSLDWLRGERDALVAAIEAAWASRGEERDPDTDPVEQVIAAQDGYLRYALADADWWEPAREELASRLASGESREAVIADMVGDVEDDDVVVITTRSIAEEIVAEWLEEAN